MNITIGGKRYRWKRERCRALGLVKKILLYTLAVFASVWCWLVILAWVM